MNTKAPAIICDLDGTLYDSKERRDKFLSGEKKDFDSFHKAATNDMPHAWCGVLLKSLAYFRYRLVFVSGRNESFRADTEQWLKHFFGWRVNDYKLFMRPDGDYTPDDKMKKKLYFDLIEPMYEVIFCVDDRKKVVDMWRSIGLPCLQCDVGDF